MAQAKPTLDTVWGSTGATTNPGATKMNLGWTSEIPTHQVQNFWQQRSDEMLTHLNEQGIAEWDAATTYPLHAWAKGSDGRVYKALQVATAQDPISTPTFWEKTGTTSGSNANGHFQINGDGTIIQWGRRSSGGSTTLTFPVAFTLAISICVSLSDYLSGDTGGLAQTSAFGGLPTTTDVLMSLAAGSDEVFWIATGV